MGGIRAATKSQGHRHLAHVRRLSAIEELRIDRAADKLGTLAKGLTDYAADNAHDGLMASASYYAGLFTQLYAAVNAASADYTDLLKMTDRPEIGEALFEMALVSLKLFAPGIAGIKEAMVTAESMTATGEAVEGLTKFTESLDKVFGANRGNDPNAGAEIRISATRDFFADLDQASKKIQRVFAEALSLVNVWKFSPQGKPLPLIRHKLAKLKLKYDVPDGVQDPTNLFTDFFLYDMVGAYVKACVSLNYNTLHGGFPGGDGAHAKPEDSYFDEAGGKYVWVDGLSEEACKKIYEMLGRKSKHAHELYSSNRKPVSRPGDLVTVWGAAFNRNSNREMLAPTGDWVNRRDAEKEQYIKQHGW